MRDRFGPISTCPPKKKVTFKDPFKRINHQKPGRQAVELDFNEPLEYKSHYSNFTDDKTFTWKLINLWLSVAPLANESCIWLAVNGIFIETA